jgi:hypothetical protein
MVSDEIGRDLHDRATSGATLSVQEQAELEHWYARQDQHERDTLTRTTPSSDLAKFRQDVDHALAQLQGVTRRVQTISGETGALKEEIAKLERQLQKNAQPA